MTARPLVAGVIFAVASGVLVAAGSACSRSEPVAGADAPVVAETGPSGSAASEPAAPGAAEAASADAAAETAATRPSKVLDRLGSYRRPVTTGSAEAADYFHQGLALTYAFNHEAAVEAFQEAARRDPQCALCVWGAALALGPNINAPMGPEAGRRAHALSQQALALVEAGEYSAVEEDLVRALATRYAAEPPQDRAALDLAYAEAMRAVQARHPEDLDVSVLTAEALMDLRPWDYWTEEGAPREHTPQAVALLEQVIAQEPAHVGAHHYYIHLMEKFQPEKAVPSADRLAELAPIAGHLVHMPSHIYWRVGRYDDARDINVRAAAADEAFFATCRPGAFYRAAYYPHNLHFLWSAAATGGESELARTTARKLRAETEPRLDEFAFVEEFVAIPLLSHARFGEWDAILGEPKPPAERPYLTGTWHYVRGLALARQGRGDEARRELEALQRVQSDPAAQTLLLAGGTATAADLLAIGAAHLEGEIAAEGGRTDDALEALRRSVALQDALVYMEPPPFYFPTRQALGAVLLEAGKPEEAEAVYREDLRRHPANGWSLFGLARSLEAQQREADAAWAKQGFANAWSDADVELTTSRF